MPVDVKTKQPRPIGEPIIAWANVLSWPISIATLVYLRIAFGSDLSFLSPIALMLIGLGLWMIVYSGLLERRLFRRLNSKTLERQAIYGGVWTSLAGIWLYYEPLGDVGLGLLLAVGLSLWPFSIREALRLKRL